MACLWVIANSQGGAVRKSKAWAASLRASNSPQLGAVLGEGRIAQGGMALNQH